MTKIVSAHEAFLQRFFLQICLFTLLSIFVSIAEASSDPSRSNACRNAISKRNVIDLLTDIDLRETSFRTETLLKSISLSKVIVPQSVQASSLQIDPERLSDFPELSDKHRIIATHYGPSIWPYETLRDWMYLVSHSQVLRNADVAQKFIENIVTNPNTCSTALSDWICDDLIMSSSAKRQSRIDATETFRQMIVRGEIDPVHGIETYHKLVNRAWWRLLDMEGIIAFPWGTDLRWPKDNQMTPQLALSIVKSLAVLTFIDHLWIKDLTGKYQPAKDLLAKEVRFLLARAPQLLALIPLFLHSPLDLVPMKFDGDAIESYDLLHLSSINLNGTFAELHSIIKVPEDGEPKLSLVWQMSAPHRQNPWVQQKLRKLFQLLLEYYLSQADPKLQFEYPTIEMEYRFINDEVLIQTYFHGLSLPHQVAFAYFLKDKFKAAGLLNH